MLVIAVVSQVQKLIDISHFKTGHFKQWSHVKFLVQVCDPATVTIFEILFLDIEKLFSFECYKGTVFFVFVSIVSIFIDLQLDGLICFYPGPPLEVI